MTNIENKDGTFLFKSKPEVVEKGWGREIIFHNDEDYCGKILIFNKDAKFSTHYHLNKRETWHIRKGKLLLKYFDLETAEEKEILLEKTNTVIINRGFPHQLTALEYSEVYEVSTIDDVNDSYRIRKGDSQNA